MSQRDDCLHIAKDLSDADAHKALDLIITDTPEVRVTWLLKELCQIEADARDRKPGASAAVQRVTGAK